ncbi:APC family permease [Mesorhizobium sp. M1329]|uniref:APC family permease n=1 Tax=Mesorhizobium sp. M1329 TaxID=2957083 RepID=UPI00333AD3B9
MTNSQNDTSTGSHARRKLGPVQIAILILAASTPLATVVTTMPLGLAFGGTSVVFAFLASGLLIALFCVGYGQMSRRITRPGAFYSYVTKGFGPVAGVATAFVALLGYIAFLAGALAIPSFFASEVLKAEFSLDVSWGLYAFFLLVAAAFFGLRGIDFNARFMCFTIVLELVLVFALVVAIIVSRGAEAFPTDIFGYQSIAGGNFGVAIIFAIMCFVGFESAALYAPEARNPEDTVRYATYLAAALITVVYAVAAWVLIGAVGSAAAQQAAYADIGQFVFKLNTQYVGVWGTTAMSFALILAQFVSFLALANATARYLSSLGKEGILPRMIGRENAETGSPSVAIVVTLLICALLVGGMGAAGLDPYTDISSVLFGIGIVAIVVLQAVASLSVIAYFSKLPEQRNWWATLVAPLLAVAGLLAATALMVSEFNLVTGKESPAIMALPWLIVVFAAAGAGQALWLKSRQPEVYELLGAGDTYQQSAKLQAESAAIASTSASTAN